ncbi:GAF domain-containing protein [Arthrobacter silvisoli]|uniref:GAF domain-containing protein n=1 Tax=Arthrobacter silvisoli TaxID=2291022 RepID=UPI000E215C3A|nr:GAF domain-containing protein [Arthrobacter silvisoli]
MSSQFESFDDVYAHAREAVGVTLFTVSVLADEGASMARVYTTHPDVYPVGGKKTLAGDTNRVWLEQVLNGQQPFLGADKEAVRSFFFDSATIESLGCGAIVNVPVVSSGRTIGSMNFLGPEGSYDRSSVDAAVDLARRSVRLLEQALTNAN